MAIARALIGRPKLLLMEDITAKKVKASTPSGYADQGSLIDFSAPGSLPMVIDARLLWGIMVPGQFANDNDD
ncbi:MAG: hypothetical protein KKB51_11270 [Candidatus Riflebacteria bacterium]|nr:hypothetical protein [Candidatus Riflebacteria bacterium]